MFAGLFSIDREIFFLINHIPHVWWSDWMALVLSGVGSAGLIWICLGVYFFFREEQKDPRFFIPTAFVLASCGVLVEGLLKYLIHRPRPSAFDGAHIVGYAGWFSMPSSHAAISWAMAVLFSRYEPKNRWIWYTLAFCISLSRIYLGMHYPSDVIVGGCIGWAVGVTALRLHTYPNHRDALHHTRRKKRSEKKRK